MQHSGYRPYILLLLVSMLWGSQFMFNEWALLSLPPTSIAIGRSLVGALALAFLLRILPPRFSQGEVQKVSARTQLSLCIIGFTEGTLPFILVPWGQQELSSSIAAILVGTIPIFTILLAVFLIPGERFRLGNVLSILFGFLGVIVLVSPDLAKSGLNLFDTLLPQLAILLSSMSFGLAMILIKRLPPIAPIKGAMYIFFWASLQMLPIWIYRDTPWALQPTLASLSAILALGVLCAGVVYVIFILLIQEAGPTFASLANYFVPVVGVILGALVFGDPVGPTTLIALLLILSAVGLNGIGADKTSVS